MNHGALKDSRGRAVKYRYRRIIGLLDGGNALRPPLVKLECGHEVRTNGINKTRCFTCEVGPKTAAAHGK